tara:strand:- start:10297 stop:10521 length:225 start_codon:yes stop_codon:yes gene_type:complete
MAFKGTAGKSSSGASMSKYDVEVEGRLKALEAKAHEQGAAGSGSNAALEGQVSALAAEIGAIKEALHNAFPGRF